MEQLDYNFLFRWFVGLNIDDPVWDPTVFTKNRDRLLRGEIAEGFFKAVVEQARAQGLLSDEHFTVDGTLIEAWASHKSFQRKDHPAEHPPPDDPGNPSVDFHGERRRNDTHQSTTDPEARLARKGSGKEAKLSFAGHVLMDNRQGLGGEGLRYPGKRARRTGGGAQDGGTDSELGANHRWGLTRVTTAKSLSRSCATTG